MFEHFTFAASGRSTLTCTSVSPSPKTEDPNPIMNARSNSLWDAASTPTVSPHDLPTPTQSPLLTKSSVSQLQHDLPQKPSPVTDLVSQLSSQTIRVEPTHLYDYAYGLPSPASPNDLDLDSEPSYDSFPVVDTDGDENTTAPSTLITLSMPKYRSTRIWGPSSARNDFRARRWKRQVGSRLLCERGMTQLEEQVDSMSKTQESQVQISTTISNDTIPVDLAAQGQPPMPEPDEGFFEDENNADTDDLEALRLFNLQRPTGIRKWRDVGVGARHGVVYRPARSCESGMDWWDAAVVANGQREGEGRPMVLSVPRMRRKIGRRKRSREGPREGGDGTTTA